MVLNPRILVLSFSSLNQDARVLRQLSAVQEYGNITTCGYGSATPYSTTHIEIPRDASSLPQAPGGIANLAFHNYYGNELQVPGVQAVIKELSRMTFDLVIANDARALPLAFSAAQGAPVWADLHEWAPEERTHVLAWKILIAPWIDHLCQKYLPHTAATTTVSARIAELYHSTYGINPAIIHNVAPFIHLTPSPVPSEGPLRIVHSGAAIPGRALEVMLEAVKELHGAFSLDLFLVPGGDQGRYLKKLKKISSDNPLIVFHSPVAPSKLPETLNHFDIGGFWIPPFNTNARLALPNKFFDFIQARLALAVGPSIEMAEIVEDKNLGVVSSDFTVESIVDSLSTLNRDNISQYKHASNAAASQLNFDTEAETIRSIITKLLVG